MDSPALTATYRVQMNARFTLAEARAVVPYLERLGISHLYASPILAAKPGSMHGYDVVDPTRLNPELGTERELRALASDLRERDMAILLDIVPNHMSAGPANRFWEDVLANGRKSRYAGWFDVDWNAERASLRGRVMLPVLGDPLERVLERNELSLVREEGRVRLKYFDHTFPVSPQTEESLGQAALERWHEGDEGRERMRALVDAQHYRLAFWRRASIAINYRRFFDVNELIALRMHDPAVFRETHAHVLQWIEDRIIDGLRIDHIDGLLDPQGYLDRLHVEMSEAQPVERSSPFIVVEKILSAGEKLRRTWPVQGTTGYEFLNELEATFIDPKGAARLEKGYQQAVGGRARKGFHESAIRGKGLVLRTALTADVSLLVRLLRRALRERRTAEQSGLAGAIRHFIAGLPVYRTYIDQRGPIHPHDREVIKQGVATARRRWGPGPALHQLARMLQRPRGEHVAAFVGRLQQISGPATAKGVEDTALYRYVPVASLNEVGGEPARDLARAVPDFHRASTERARHWPRSLLCTSTHDTKRSADVRSRLDVLSEMPDEWIRQVARWRKRLAGHRTEVRRGLAPDTATEWLLYQTMLGIWPLGRLSADETREMRDRLVEYMTKANREAKVRTSWILPDEGYEKAVERYIDAALADDAFVREMSAIAAQVAPPGFCNALARLLVHLTAPGTPDIYHGDELWNFALVDPDNRRPVDFDARRRALDDIDALIESSGLTRACETMLERLDDGRLKMHIARSALTLRKERVDLYAGGEYRALRARGPRSAHVLAFSRSVNRDVAITAVTRLPFSLSGGEGLPTGLAWGDEHVILSEGKFPPRWRCVLSGRTVEVVRSRGGVHLAARELFQTLPVALLVPA